MFIMTHSGLNQELKTFTTKITIHIKVVLWDLVTNSVFDTFFFIQKPQIHEQESNIKLSTLNKEATLEHINWLTNHPTSKYEKDHGIVAFFKQHIVSTSTFFRCSNRLYLVNTAKRENFRAEESGCFPTGCKSSLKGNRNNTRDAAGSFIQTFVGDFFALSWEISNNVM